VEVIKLLISVVVLFVPIITTSGDFYLNSQESTRSLTQEEIHQIENEPIATLENCRTRSDFDPGGLCLAFYEYLESKCFRLEFLPSYCGAVARYNDTASAYALSHSMAEQCRQNPPPLPNDTEGIKKCIGSIQFDSRYNTMPPELKISSIDVQDNESKTVSVEDYLKSQVNKTTELNRNPILVKIDFSIENPNIGRIHVQEISFNVSQKGNMVLYDRIGSTDPTSCGGFGCISYPINGLTTYHIVRENEAQPGKIDLHDSKYLINAILDYKHDNSEEILSKSFALGYP
jgi:hypothetical protein